MKAKWKKKKWYLLFTLHGANRRHLISYPSQITPVRLNLGENIGMGRQVWETAQEVKGKALIWSRKKRWVWEATWCAKLSPGVWLLRVIHEARFGLLHPLLSPLRVRHAFVLLWDLTIAFCSEQITTPSWNLRCWIWYVPICAPLWQINGSCTSLWVLAERNGIATTWKNSLDSNSRANRFGNWARLPVHQWIGWQMSKSSARSLKYSYSFSFLRYWAVKDFWGESLIYVNIITRNGRKHKNS